MALPSPRPSTFLAGHGFNVAGVDNENGGELLNHQLNHRPKKHGIEQTQWRPDYERVQVYLEQKILTHVRRFLDYERFGRRDLLDDFDGLLRALKPTEHLFYVATTQGSKHQEGSHQILRGEKKGRRPAVWLIDTGQLPKEKERKRRP